MISSAMNTSWNLNYFIPITHIVVVCTMVSIITSIACWYQYQYIFFAILLLSALIAIKAASNTKIIVFCAIICSVCIHEKIKNKKQEFAQHHEFLKTPVTIRAFVAQKNINSLSQDHVILILRNCQIQKSYHNVLPTIKNLMLQIPATKAVFIQQGQEILIQHTILQQPSTDQDFYGYLLKENIWATSFITNQKIKILNKKTSLMNQCYQFFIQTLGTENMQLFDSLFLGKRDKNFKNISLQHQSLYWGIAHHMARSGIHVTTLLSLFLGICHILRIRYFYRYVICSTLAFLYFQISITSLSFLRALCMIFIQMFARLHQFNYSSVHALALTTLIIIIQNPFCIFFLDFQLSFGITAAIIWLFAQKYSKTIVLPRTNSLPL